MKIFIWVLFTLISKLFELCLVLLADLNQVQLVFSKLKQLIEKQNNDIVCGNPVKDHHNII